MAIKIALNHKTEYRFDRPVSLSPHVVRLRPAPHARTPIEAYSLKVHPAKHFINWQQDPFGNYLARLVFLEKARRLTLEVDAVADMTVINPFDFFPEEYAERYPFGYESRLAKELEPYREIGEDGPRLKAWLAGVSRKEKRTVDFLVELNSRLQRDIGYLIRMEPGIQSCEETLGKATGSCRDSAWLLVQILRHLGLAARFVSGYLVQLTADVKSLDGPSGPEADFTDLHAWAEVYVPGAGWLGLDPTSGLFAGEGHIPLACTPNPADAAPVTGATDECETEFYFHNQVTRIHEDPRVTKPYTEEQWQAIETLGHQIDVDLDQRDVRLTMGGEPTFVSIDDMDGAEWNIAALGDDKSRLSADLIRRLKARFATGGMLHYGQGKWYPGEPLPRWSMSCYWRDDDIPVWRDPTLLAESSRDYGHRAEQVREFIHTLARYLGLASNMAQPAYEDALYYLWKEAKLPEGMDPLEADLKDPLARKRLARLLDRGLGEVTGYALPLKWDGDEHEGCWRSAQWSFRRGRLYLLPGDSPMGYRLPLDSLLHGTEKDEPPERSPFEPRGELDDYGEVARRYSQRVVEEPATEGIREQVAESSEDGDSPVRTTLCVESREGRLHVFLPPLTHLEHFLNLVARIEACATECELPVVIEGYPPPPDHRLLRLSVTPDPGVIEVNIHPAHDWGQLAHVTETLYEEARQARLGTEKFMLDGRHTGTGGGNHVTLGGPTPDDSPMLRRPDLLQSLITYWQHHPSLSYLFSGLFIGPTSQAPRVDEARDESLHELEIAFQQIPEGEVPAPWLVDRLLRNLLVDTTGNTHRTEFCIDKLYSPDTASGRLGLVEFRAFEMPPHPRMSLVQMLLLRSLIARFWDQPYDHKPVRWGTELHDRFLLPHFVWQDFRDVICDQRRAGYPLQLEWFAPFLEFRFPHFGTIRSETGISLELRTAIEPWHVLGEEVTSHGTARFVDSSVERLQVKVNGMTNERHLVTCNGRRLPLRNTGRRGECVAGVRFKAWQPPSGLHPAISAQAPLVFDLVDTWNRRSIGGCTYHVEHPGGRNPDTFPVNANEAEARRMARFFAHGHTPGPMNPPAEEPSRDFPYTLDLRYRPRC